MGRGKRDFGDYYVQWDHEARKVTITPRYPNASVTDFFGLGNAKIKLNANNLPQDIVMEITGETTGGGLLPTSPFKLRRWYSAPTGLSKVTKTITGFNGWSEQITYFQANGGSVKEASSVNIVQNGYGVKSIQNGERLGW